MSDTTTDPNDLDQFQGPRREREGGGTQTRPPDESSDPSAEPLPEAEPTTDPAPPPTPPPPPATPPKT